jgi:hypothetical protein
MIIKNKIVNNSIFLFFIFGSLFLTFRLLLIGSKASDSITEYSISILPELFVLFILIYFLIPIVQKKTILKFNYFDWIVISYIFFNVLIGVSIAQNLKVSLYAIRMSYLPMLFYFYSSNYAFDIIDMKSLVDKIFKWLVVVGVIGLVLYFGFFDMMMAMILKTKSVASEYFIVRMTSIFWTPVLFGTFMTTSYLYFFYKSTQSNSILNYSFQAIIAICVFLSVTRGAIVILFIGLILLTIISRKWKPFLISLTIMTIVFISVAYYIATPAIFLDWIWHSTSETIGLKKGVTRVDLWIQAFSDFKDYPLGRGLGKAGHVAARFFDKSSVEASATSTDGWFLKLANETGVFGLFSYFVLSLLLFISSIHYIRKFGYDFFSFLFVIFIVINIQNLVSNVLDFYLFSYLYWLLIGIMILHFKLKNIGNG